MPLHVAAAGESAREVDRHRSAIAGGAVDVRTTRERQPQQPGDLVERFPRCIVHGRAERLDSGRDVVDEQQTRMSTADEERDAGLRQLPVFELVDSHMRGEMVDAVQRLAE